MKPRQLREMAQDASDDEVVEFCELFLAALEIPEIREAIQAIAGPATHPNVNPPQPRRTTPTVVRGRGGRRG